MSDFGHMISSRPRHHGHNSLCCDAIPIHFNICRGDVPTSGLGLCHTRRKRLHFEALFQSRFIYRLKIILYIRLSTYKASCGMLSPPSFFQPDLTLRFNIYKKRNFLYERENQCCEHRTGIKAAFVFSVR